ncbi:MAG: phosphatase PAP2 family protein [Flavobacteriaceae bacterium]
MRWLLLWAVIVAYSRVYVGVHYPIDIISGAFFGSLMASFLHVLHDGFYFLNPCKQTPSDTSLMSLFSFKTSGLFCLNLFRRGIEI